MTVGDTVESMKYLFKVFECRLTRSSYARFAPGVSSTRTLTAYAKTRRQRNPRLGCPRSGDELSVDPPFGGAHNL